MKKKCLIFIDADVVYRHFVHSRAFLEINRKFETQYIFPEKNNKRLGNIDIQKFDKKIKKIRINHHPTRLKIWRQLLFVQQLRFSTKVQNKAMANFRRKTLKWKASLLFTFFGLPLIWELFKKIKFYQLKRNPNIELENLILDFKPDVIIHPCVLEGLFLNDLIQISSKKVQN